MDNSKDLRKGHSSPNISQGSPTRRLPASSLEGFKLTNPPRVSPSPRRQITPSSNSRRRKHSAPDSRSSSAAKERPAPEASPTSSHVLHSTSDARLQTQKDGSNLRESGSHSPSTSSQTSLSQIAPPRPSSRHNEEPGIVFSRQPKPAKTTEGLRTARNSSKAHSRGTTTSTTTTTTADATANASFDSTFETLAQSSSRTESTSKRSRHPGGYRERPVSPANDSGTQDSFWGRPGASISPTLPVDESAPFQSSHFGPDPHVIPTSQKFLDKRPATISGSSNVVSSPNDAQYTGKTFVHLSGFTNTSVVYNQDITARGMANNYLLTNASPALQPGANILQTSNLNVGHNVSTTVTPSVSLANQHCLS
jgi:hypothetical protein